MREKGVCVCICFERKPKMRFLKRGKRNVNIFPKGKCCLCAKREERSFTGGWGIWNSRRETFLKRAVSHKRAFVTQLVSHREVREKVFGKMARQKAKRKTRLPVPFWCDVVFTMACAAFECGVGPIKVREFFGRIPALKNSVSEYRWMMELVPKNSFFSVVGTYLGQKSF